MWCVSEYIRIVYDEVVCCNEDVVHVSFIVMLMLWSSSSLWTFCLGRSHVTGLEKMKSADTAILIRGVRGHGCARRERGGRNRRVTVMTSACVLMGVQILTQITFDSTYLGHRPSSLLFPSFISISISSLSSSSTPFFIAGRLSRRPTFYPAFNSANYQLLIIFIPPTLSCPSAPPPPSVFSIPRPLSHPRL